MRFFFRFFLILNIIILFYLLSFIYTPNVSKFKKYINQKSFKTTPTIKFDSKKHVLIFLHIQKTGGSDFDRFLIKNLVFQNNQKACRFLTEIKISSLLKPNKQMKKFRKFKCERLMSKKISEPSWYFSRQTFGWSCGLHANFMQLKTCVTHFYPGFDPNNGFFFFTILRHPIKRYLSEWKHVSRGATWIRKNQKTSCQTERYVKCFKGAKNWQNVTLNEFMSCEYNLANNRQTRMLSNLKTGCENISDRIMLQQAKKNLEKMYFFALNEFQHYSQKMFETSFPDFKLTRNLTQLKNTTADFLFRNFSKNQSDYLIKKIESLNSLDIELYKFAVNLFFKKLNLNGIL